MDTASMNMVIVVDHHERWNSKSTRGCDNPGGPSHTKEFTKEIP